MTILCATNFSPEALDATTVAAEFARQRGEELWLVYVLPKDTARVFGEQVQSTAKGALEAEAARARRLGATVKHALLIGKLLRELPRFAAENQIDLVLAGDTRKDPDFVGSGTLVRLAQHLQAPLWVVRDPKPLIGWAKGERTLKVMLGVDRSQSTQAAVRWLTKLSGYGKLEVVGGHVFWPPVEYGRLGLPLPRTWDELRPELLQTLHRELLETLPPALSGRIRIEPGFGRVADHLNALALDEQVDLLVNGGRPHAALGQLWSVSEQCLQLASMSVVRVPDAAGQALSQTISPVQRVLAATDFSPAGDRAVAQALAILNPGGTLDLVHVSPGPLSAAEERQVVERLLERVPDGSTGRGFTIQGHALQGLEAAPAIVAAAERFTSQVICLGSRGRAGLTRLLLGSTAQEVLNATHRPVLIVKPSES